MPLIPFISIETGDGRLNIRQGDCTVTVRYSPVTGTKDQQLWSMRFEELFEALVHLGLPQVAWAQKQQLEKP